MDDRNFNPTTAAEWIRIIEDPRAAVRENDIYPILRNWLSSASPENVLDAGCGQGICSIHLGETQTDYFGMDASPDLILRAQELYANVARKFIIGDMYAIPFKNSTFSAVFSVAVWHLLFDIEKASGELSRVLKTGGKFLIITADPDQYSSWTDQYFEKRFEGASFFGTKYGKDEAPITDTLYLHTMEEILSALESANLTVSSVRTIRSFIVISGQKS